MSNDRLWNRAQRYLAEGQPVAARVALESFLQRDPTHAEAHLILGTIAWKDYRLSDAVRHAKAAAANLPDDAAVISEVGDLLHKVGEIVAARACMERAAAGTQDGAVLMRLAELRGMLGEHPESLALLDRAGAAGIDDAEYRYQRALELTFNGRLPEAESEHEASLRIDPTNGRAALALVRMRKKAPQPDLVDALAESIRDRKSVV